MPTKIQKWGNSLGLRIPRPLAEEMGFEAGSEVTLVVREGELVAAPVGARYRLADLLAGVNADNVHDEIDTGSPTGREVW